MQTGEVRHRCGVPSPYRPRLCRVLPRTLQRCLADLLARCRSAELLTLSSPERRQLSHLSRISQRDRCALDCMVMRRGLDLLLMDFSASTVSRSHVADSAQSPCYTTSVSHCQTWNPVVDLASLTNGCYRRQQASSPRPLGTFVHAHIASLSNGLNHLSANRKPVL